MALRKLWNSLFGKSKSAPSAESDDNPKSQPHRKSKRNAGVQRRGESPIAGRVGPDIKSTDPAGRGKPAAARRLLSLGRGPHRPLCKLVGSTQPGRVLEISVGDGSRATAMLATLTAKRPRSATRPIEYAAIDLFELAPSSQSSDAETEAQGPLSLKRFHQILRRENVLAARIFPDTIERGLRRVLTTIGQIDLVVIAAPPSQWQTPEVLALLERVTHSGSTVLYLNEQTWTRLEPLAGPQRRAA